MKDLRSYDEEMAIEELVYITGVESEYARMGQCEWCEREKIQTFKHSNNNYHGWYCADCVWLSNCASDCCDSDES
jgi:hypothetical protein